MNRALIVVDVQVDFCEGGALGVDGGNTVAIDVAKLLESNHGYSRVVATRDHHIDPGSHFSDHPDFIDSWPPHCVVGTPGQQLQPALRERDFDAVFDKGSYRAAYSGFEGTIGGVDDGIHLADWLRAQRVDRVDVCGIATDFCVRATALDAAREGFATRVLGRLTAAVHPDAVPAVVEEFTRAGVEWTR
ncbi:MAG: isochorismatase family protein [Acidipropionibacterium sp.]|jgi:nicotinamidase/pyrazinamidase|nr:isochorismatase family protein [Acidipropionibacterium sp.]